MWKYGRTARRTSSSSHRNTPSTWTMLAVRLRWVSITPLGKPVVPLEYGSAARSSGPIGSAGTGAPRRSAEPTTSTRALPAAVDTDGSSSADVMTNRAPASPSWRPISAVVSAGFTGVTTPPCSSVAWKTTANSGTFGSTTPTTSPGRCPAFASAPAAAAISPGRSPYAIARPEAESTSAGFAPSLRAWRSTSGVSELSGRSIIRGSDSTLLRRWEPVMSPWTRQRS